MRVRIHRGTKEIGGTCIELEAENKRIVLDVGRPLDADLNSEVPLPDVPGLASGDDPNLLGLLISHGHLDHWGLVSQVSENVPIYMGEGAASVLRAAVFFSPAGVSLNPVAHFRHRHPIQIGPFTVTPYLNDHNGFDTYSLLIEAGNRRLFYSADFQGHGRKSDSFREILRKPPEGVDVMLMEGTNVRAELDLSVERTESDVEVDIAHQVLGTSGMTLVTFSSQNIDRFVTLYRVAKRTGRTLVLDLYTATIAEAANRESIPRLGWSNLGVYVPNSQRIRVAKSKEFNRVESIKEFRLFPEDLKERRNELILTFRMSMAREIERADCLEGASAIWSLWPGYLQRPSELHYHEFLKRHHIPMQVHHASGHAYLEDLKRLAAAVGATRLVPIHSFATHKFVDHFENVHCQQDGQWWEI